MSDTTTGTDTGVGAGVDTGTSAGTDAKHPWGLLRWWASFGAAGLTAGWLFMFELPALRNENTAREARLAQAEETRMSRQVSQEERRNATEREDRKAARDHGTSVGDRLGKATEELARALAIQTETIREQTSALDRNQAKTHENQAAMIKQNAEQLELTKKKMAEK